MKDTILNLTVIAAAFVAIVSSAVTAAPADQTVVAQATRVVEMQKTVVAAKRLPADVMVLASAQYAVAAGVTGSLRSAPIGADRHQRAPRPPIRAECPDRHDSQSP